MARRSRSAIHLKSPAEVQAMSRCGDIISALFAEIEPLVRPGAATAALDSFVDDFVRSHQGAVPAFKGLYGFPGSACISINEEVVHGIPSKRTLRDGDIVSIDVGVRRGGWCADSAYTFAVGEIGPEAADLAAVTYASLEAAVAAAQAGGHVGDIGAAVVDTVQGSSYRIIRDLVGHGVGRDIHEEPQVSNIGRAGYGTPLRPGMVLAIEPMVNAGRAAVRVLEDGWTAVTVDGSLSAHFEHSVAVSKDGPVVLSRRD
jgi:methionyl aminopeptidase